MASMLLDLVSNQLNTEKVYEYHLNVAIAKMSNCLADKQLSCVHRVLCNTPGYFVFDTPRCIEYIIVHMHKLGFTVDYLGDCVMCISWQSKAVQQKVRPPGPKMSQTQTDALKKIKKQLKVSFKLPPEEY